MSGFIPEITTTVKVGVNQRGLDESIALLESDELTNAVFADVINHINNVKNEMDNFADEAAYRVSQNLSSWQSEIISMKHEVTGMMMNSVDISQDGNAQYLVGNTAMSVDGFPYPLAIEKGSTSHWVAPVTFKALHWFEKDGTEKFSKGHMVSGITADPFVQYSIDNSMEDVEDILTKGFSEIFK